MAELALSPQRIPAKKNKKKCKPAPTANLRAPVPRVPPRCDALAGRPSVSTTEVAPAGLTLLNMTVPPVDLRLAPSKAWRAANPERSPRGRRSITSASRSDGKVSCSDGWSAWSATVREKLYSLVRIIAMWAGQLQPSTRDRERPKKTLAARVSAAEATHDQPSMVGLRGRAATMQPDPRRLPTDELDPGRYRPCIRVARAVEWTHKVTRRFCESASRRATAGQLPTATSRTVSSPALESRFTTIVVRSAVLAVRRRSRRPHGCQGTRRAAGVTGSWSDPCGACERRLADYPRTQRWLRAR